jgi:hypothetical protein
MALLAYRLDSPFPGLGDVLVLVTDAPLISSRGLSLFV